MGAQEDYEGLQSLAERLGLDDKQKDGFINESMQRLGYKPRMEWDDAPDDDGASGGGSFFGGGGKQQRQQRDVGGGGGRQQQQRQQGAWGYN